MIKQIRVVEWFEGLREARRLRWEIQVMLVGSTKWTPIGYKFLRTKPKQLAKDAP